MSPRSEQSTLSYSGFAVQTSSRRWAGPKLEHYQNSWTWPIGLQMERTRTTTREQDHIKTIDPIDITVRGADLVIMTTTTR
jgi:hypothetical protein